MDSTIVEWHHSYSGMANDTWQAWSANASLYMLTAWLLHTKVSLELLWNVYTAPCQHQRLPPVIAHINFLLVVMMLNISAKFSYLVAVVQTSELVMLYRLPKLQLTQ